MTHSLPALIKLNSILLNKDNNAIYSIADASDKDLFLLHGDVIAFNEEKLSQEIGKLGFYEDTEKRKAMLALGNNRISIRKVRPVCVNVITSSTLIDSG